MVFQYTLVSFIICTTLARIGKKQVPCRSACFWYVICQSQTKTNVRKNSIGYFLIRQEFLLFKSIRKKICKHAKQVGHFHLCVLSTNIQLNFDGHLFLQGGTDIQLNFVPQKLWTVGKSQLLRWVPPKNFIVSEPILFYFEPVPIILTLTYWTFLEFQSNLTVFCKSIELKQFCQLEFSITTSAFLS